jgi:hypothetical protein
MQDRGYGLPRMSLLLGTSVNDTDLEAGVLHPLQRLAHLHGLCPAIQVFVLDPCVQHLGGVLGELGHAPQPLPDRARVFDE